MKLRGIVAAAASCLISASIFVPLRSGAADACIEVITCACNDQTGECREFGTPCDVPPDWTIVGYSYCPVPAGAIECLDVISYARNPDTGECVEFPSSCTPPGWERCAGGA